MKNLRLITVLFLVMQYTYSQEGAPFSENKNLYVRGNSILIGNNILGDHSNKPLSDLTIPNDLVKMKYIDVDEDKSTFSSSEATINNAIGNTKIAYAVLYWSALYPFEKGVLHQSGKRFAYEGKGIRDTVVNSILFKIPGGDYQTITGNIIFDSFKTGAFSTNVPYGCYADVTSDLQKLSTLNGTYAVANIKATEGEISGGGSAGWLLYIVYEDSEESPKYFTIYNGLVEVSKQAVDISFSNFKSIEEGKIKTNIALGALEGDRKLKTDEFSIFDKKNGSYKALSNNVREEKNFFNSSITINDEVFAERNPNSINTLGFDLLKMEIPNPNNDLFDNATTQADLRFQAKADRFYLFFVAFETEINNRFYQEKINSITSNGANAGTKSTTEIMDSLNIEIAASKAIVSQKNKKIISQTKENKKPEITTDEARIKKEVRIQSMSVPGMDAGYYVVTNVFSVPGNTIKWSQFLNEKKYRPQTFINPRNNWQYVYISKSDNPIPVYEKWKEYKGFEYFKEIWIMKINL